MPYVVDAYGPWIAKSPVTNQWNNLMRQAMEYNAMQQRIRQAEIDREAELATKGFSRVDKYVPEFKQGQEIRKPVQIGDKLYRPPAQQGLQTGTIGGHQFVIDPKGGFHWAPQSQGAYKPGELKTIKTNDPQSGKAIFETIRYTGRPNSNYRGNRGWEFFAKGQRFKPTGTTINMAGNEAFKELTEVMAKDLLESRKGAEGAASGLRNLYEARNIIDEGMFTGSGAEMITGINNFLVSRLGFKEYEDPTANTQAYAAAMGRQVGEIIKQFGAGTGLSDADREYAEKIAAGKVTMTEKALRRLIDINERAYRAVLNQYNKRAEQVKKRPWAKDLMYDLSVDVPEYKGINTAEEYLKGLGY